MRRIREHIFVRLLLLSLFMVYFSSINCFSHRHIVNGENVVHSHPFKAMSHTGNQLETIALLSLFQSTGAFVSMGVPDVPELLLSGLKSVVSSSFVRPAFLCSLSLRAPPALFQ